jgi:hypothetical protein
MMENFSEKIDANYNYNFIVMQTIGKMRDAQARGDLASYWIYFDYALGLVSSYIEAPIAREIQNDYNILNEAIRKIEESNIAETSKKMHIEKLRANFADAHRFYVMNALNRIGVLKLEDEGVIDFSLFDMERTTRVVRNSVSLKEGTSNEFEVKKIVHIPPEEEVLVYYNNRIIAMPKSEYMKYREEQEAQKNAKKEGSQEEGNNKQEEKQLQENSQQEEQEAAEQEASAPETQPESEQEETQEEGDEEIPAPTPRE